MSDTNIISLSATNLTVTEETTPSPSILVEQSHCYPDPSTQNFIVDPVLPLMLVSVSEYSELKIHNLVFLRVTCRVLSDTIRPVIVRRLAKFEPDVDDPELWQCVDSGDEGIDIGEVELYQVARLVVMPSLDRIDTLFQIGSASQGGPIYGTALHIVALLGEFTLCQALVDLGANLNANLLIPNDQDSDDKSISASNKDDGSDFSQYRWGWITPLRLARLFRHREIAQMLLENGGVLGRSQNTSLPLGFMVGSTFAVGRPGFRSLPDDACWTSADSSKTEIYYLNTYMNGQRVYPSILFEYNKA